MEAATDFFLDLIVSFFATPGQTASDRQRLDHVGSDVIGRTLRRPDTRRHPARHQAAASEVRRC